MACLRWWTLSPPVGWRTERPPTPAHEVCALPPVSTYRPIVERRRADRASKIPAATTSPATDAGSGTAGGRLPPGWETMMPAIGTAAMGHQDIPPPEGLKTWGADGVKIGGAGFKTGSEGTGAAGTSTRGASGCGSPGRLGGRLATGGGSKVSGRWSGGAKVCGRRLEVLMAVPATTGFPQSS